MAKKPSIFQRALDKIKSVWRKEEKAHPPPPPDAPIEKKESWFKRQFSAFVEASPWSRFKKRREETIKKDLEQLEKTKKELQRELKELRKTDDFPKVEVEAAPELEEQPKLKHRLIDEPEFAGERFRSRRVYESIARELESFAKDPPRGVIETEVDIPPPKILSSGGFVLSSRFVGLWDANELRDFLRELQTLMANNEASWFPFRVSIVFQFDPSRLSGLNFEDDGVTLPIYDKDRGKDVRKKYDFFKGYIEIPMNVSYDIPKSFITAANDLLPTLQESFGDVPSAMTFRITWGSDIVKISRKAVRV